MATPLPFRSSLFFLGLGLAVACGQSANDGPTGDNDNGDSGTGGRATDDNSGSDLSTDGLTDLGDLSDGFGGGGPGDGSGPVCEQVASEAVPAEIELAFAFDVSGSMGALDCPYWYHDPVLKWAPVVAATTAFFENPANSTMRASMTLFPADDDKCDDEMYETPDVPMTTLPSTRFRQLLEDYAEDAGVAGLVAPVDPDGGDFRGGTPTAPVIQGTSTWLNAAKQPGISSSIVLVTDGYPQGCSGSSSSQFNQAIAAVEAALENGIRTFVIGVEQPRTPPVTAPWAEGWNCGDEDDDNEPRSAPETLENLNALAEAGGTGTAFLIDTGDPVSTEARFAEAVEQIRTQAVACDWAIPPHPTQGARFEADKIDVSLSSGTNVERLPYDPGCDEADGWHFDNVDAPGRVVLCESSCKTLEAAPNAAVRVDFLCEPRLPVIR